MIYSSVASMHRTLLCTRLGLSLASIALASATAFAQSPAASTPAQGDMAKMTMPAAKSMMQPTDMARSMEKMHAKMAAMSMTGDPDMDFAMMMKVHHEGAVEMAQAELDHGKNLAMRNAAKKIIVAQKKEIAEFDRWMQKHPAMKSDAMGK